MILNIVSNYEPEYIQSILEEDINQTYFKVTYRQSHTRRIHEFCIDDNSDQETCISFENLQEIMADLNLSPWELRIIATPND